MGGVTSTNAEALLNARILSDEKDSLLFLTSSTEIYDHDVIGNAIEARSFPHTDDLQAEKTLQLFGCRKT